MPIIRWVYFTRKGQVQAEWTGSANTQSKVVGLAREHYKEVSHVYEDPYAEPDVNDPYL